MKSPLKNYQRSIGRAENKVYRIGPTTPFLQYTAGLPEQLLQNISPELWMLDWNLMKKPGNIDMQFELNCDFKSNIGMFPVFQNYFRTHQPRVLVIWGKYDVFFNVEEAHCYKRDLPDAEVHIIDGGHMILETNFDEVLKLVENFCVHGRANRSQQFQGLKTLRSLRLARCNFPCFAIRNAIP